MKLALASYISEELRVGVLGTLPQTGKQAEVQWSANRYRGFLEVKSQT